MPSSAPSRCTRRCGRLATQGGRCDDHQRKPWENTSKRNQVIDKGRWAKAKRAQLERESQCRVCASTDHLEVDHITEVTDGGSLYEHSNLQTLCEEHHAEKTALMRTLRAARREASDGGGAFGSL